MTRPAPSTALLVLIGAAPAWPPRSRSAASTSAGRNWLARSRGNASPAERTSCSAMCTACAVRVCGRALLVLSGRCAGLLRNPLADPHVLGISAGPRSPLLAPPPDSAPSVYRLRPSAGAGDTGAALPAGAARALCQRDQQRRAGDRRGTSDWRDACIVRRGADEPDAGTRT